MVPLIRCDLTGRALSYGAGPQADFSRTARIISSLSFAACAASSGLSTLLTLYHSVFSFTSIAQTYLYAGPLLIHH